MSALAIFHADAATYLAEVLRAHDAGLPVFLGNPHWGPAELTEAARQIPQGTLIQGLTLAPRGLGTCDWPLQWRGRLMIPTGGTGGKVKFIIHSAETLRAAAFALQAALVARGHAPTLHGVTCTPPWHVSGLMPAIRARITGGQHLCIDGRFRPAETLPMVTLPPGGTKIISLVPAQLSRLFARAEGEAWLRAFDVILLGGSSVPAGLLTAIRTRRLPVTLTYGATETAAACALCPPEKIWTGATLYGEPLPGVRFGLNPDGVITIDSPALGLGLWPDGPSQRPWTSGDRGEVTSAGHVRVLGRADRVIITGGEKVDPARVEAVLLATGQAVEAIVIGQADAQWGEVVTACIVGTAEAEPILRKACETLEPAARPRRYLFVAALPLNAQGKLDRTALTALLA